MSVLFITENLMEGGSQAFILRLAEGLQSRGIEVKVLLLNKEMENKLLTSQYPTVQILSINLPLKSIFRFIDRILFRFGSDFSIVSLLHRRILKRKYVTLFDIFHTHYPKVDLLVSSLKNIKQVVTVHGDYQDQYEHALTHKRSIWNQFNQKILSLKKNVDAWVVISDEQRNFFINRFNFQAEKMEKIYNGFLQNDSSNALQKTTEKFSIGMIARGVEEKGWEAAIKAFLSMNVDSQLLLAGKGQYLDELQNIYSSHSSIFFLGYQANSLPFIKACDVMLLPSYSPTESLPYVVIEALSCAKPVLASDVGELRKMITDEETGELAGEILLLKDGRVDSKELTEAIKKLYVDQNLLKHKSALAVKAFAKFKMDKCLDAYTSLYDRLLNDK